MVAFVELSRDVLEKHWIPKVFGAAGNPLVEAFKESEQQIWAIVEKVLDPQQKNVLQTTISTWRKRHPDQINVETVRLSAFSTQAGARAAGLDESVGGLFASLEQSTQAVDSARLFSERALYYAERAPFLFQLQARLGASEIVSDTNLSLSQLPSEPAIRDVLKEVRETLSATRATLADANATSHSVDVLMSRMMEHPQATQLATNAVTQLTALLKEWNHLLSSPSYKMGVSKAADVASVVDQQSNRLLKKVAGLGFSLIAFFWMMFVLAKLAYRYVLLKTFSARLSERRAERRNEGREKHEDRAA
jgi:hypothetical protein